MIIYIDNDNKCHAEADEGLREFNVPFFDGKCATFIEGYRFVPAVESWTRPDGIVFIGGVAFHWKPYSELDAAQRNYEKQKLKN